MAARIELVASGSKGFGDWIPFDSARSPSRALGDRGQHCDLVECSYPSEVSKSNLDCGLHHA